MNRIPNITCDAWLINNGKESHIFRTKEKACAFIGIRLTSFGKHYNSGTATKSGWTIDKIEVEKE